MHLLALLLSATLMVAMPCVLGVLLARRLGMPWRLFGLGVATFIGSQVLHIPFNFLVQNVAGLFRLEGEAWMSLLPTALFLGLSAGVFEETARAVMYRTWAKEARTWARGLMLGAGHGGIEAILVGILTLVNGIVLWVLRGNPEALDIPAEQMAAVQAQIGAVFDGPWPLLLLGAVERATAIAFHLAASLMVMRMFVTGRSSWLLAAILWHTALNAVAVIGIVRLGPVPTEAILLLFGVVSLLLVRRWRAPEPELPPVTALAPSVELRQQLVAPTAEALHNSRFDG